jgi:uncharacterized protein (TIGR03083 family)
MDSAAETVQLVIAESERLTQYLTTLPPEAWRKPSACDRWQVRDVVAHLAGQAENYAAWIAHSLQGDASTPEGLPAAGSATAASFAEAAAQRVVARREQLGDQLLSAFITTSAQLNHLLASLDPEDWGKPHYTALGSAPLRHYPADRLLELVVHGWDIRSRLEPDAHLHLSDASVPVLVEETLRRACRWRFQPGPRLLTPIRYRVALTGAGATEHDMVVTGDQASVEPGGTAVADVLLRCDPGTFVLLMLGRLPLSDALAQRRLVAEGAREQVSAFAQWFQGA